MKKILFALCLALASASCTKNSNTSTPTPSTPTTGTIQLINNSNNAYTVTINGTIETNQPGKTSQSFTKPFGTYAVHVKQMAGYILYPTEEDFSGTLSASNKTIIISYP